MTKLVRIDRVEPAGEFLLHVWFDTGEHGLWTADFRHRKGPMAVPLHDPSFVAQAFVEFGAVSWPNGFDASADFVHEEMRKAGTLRDPQVAAE